MGAQNVPTLFSLKKAQQAVHTDTGDPTIKCTSTQGSVYYLNDLSKAIAQVRVAWL